MTSLLMDNLRVRFRTRNKLLRDIMADVYVTGRVAVISSVLWLGGCSSTAQYKLSAGTYMADYTSVAFGWGLALLVGLLVSHRTSGSSFIPVLFGRRTRGHLNPAVSFFLLSQGKISVVRFVCYSLAQNIGAFFSSAFVYIVYYDAIAAFDGGIRQVTGEKATAGIWATYPAAFLTTRGAILDQIVGTMVLCIGVAGISDSRTQVPTHMRPFFAALLVTLIGMSLGLNAGYAINPARDFGPRLFTAIAGYGWECFSFRDYSYFWVPIVCPVIGATLGAWIYEFAIGFHLPDDEEEEEQTTSSQLGESTLSQYEVKTQSIPF